MTKDNNKYQEEQSTDVFENQKRILVVYNDDYHTFDYVIDALVDVCKHDEIQATQCTYLIHHKGHSDVKNGTYSYLKPLRDTLQTKDLKAVIE